MLFRSEGKSTTFTVNVITRAVSSIFVEPPSKKNYTVGESINYTGMVITATWNNGSTTTLDCPTNALPEGVTASGYNSTSAGTKTITVGYEGKTTAITVSVTDSTSPNAGDLKTVTIPGAGNYNLRYVPIGTFKGANNFIATITKGYWMLETEVTQGLWKAVMGNNPSKTKTSDLHPVEQVSWYDAIAFCNKLSIAAGLTTAYSVEGVNWSTLQYSGIPTSSNSKWSAAAIVNGATGYRLPTEMEWQWAAMGAQDNNGNGYTKAFSGSNGSNKIVDYAWITTNSGNKTHQVGTTKYANELNIFDMTGNVTEWCWDLIGPSQEGNYVDYTGPSSGTSRFLRGSTAGSNGDNCCLAVRNTSNAPDIRYLSTGFRVVLP